MGTLQESVWPYCAESFETVIVGELEDFVGLKEFCFKHFLGLDYICWRKILPNNKKFIPYISEEFI